MKFVITQKEIPVITLGFSALLLQMLKTGF